MARQVDLESDADWLAVIGRSLAFLCLSAADLRDKDIGQQGRLLSALGLSRHEAAAMLGTSADSLRVLLARKNGGKKKNARKSTRKGGSNGKSR